MVDHGFPPPEATIHLRTQLSANLNGLKWLRLHHIFISPSPTLHCQLPPKRQLSLDNSDLEVWHEGQNFLGRCDVGGAVYAQRRSECRGAQSSVPWAYKRLHPLNNGRSLGNARRMVAAADTGRKR